MEWKMYDHDDKATLPIEKGTYRVMVAGDFESVDGHTIYEYPDYPTWSEVIEDEEDGGLRFMQGTHDEEPDTFFAYYGPVVPVPPFNIKTAK